MRLYLDTAPIIYAVEQVAPFALTVKERISSPGDEIVTSELARMECRIKPLRDRNQDLLRDHDRFLDETMAEVVSLTRAVLERASELRAEYQSLKTPDAIHLAAALLVRSDTFYTNDHRLDFLRASVLPIEVIEG